MKWLLCLLIGMLVASPAVGQMTREEAGQMSASDARILAVLQTITEDLAELKTDMAEVKADVAELKVDMAEVKTELAVMKADMGVMKTDIAELKADVAILKTDVAELKTEFAVMKADMGVMQADIAELQTNVTGLKTDVEDVKVGIAGTHGDVRGSINIASHLQDRMTSQTNALFLIAGLLVTILLWMLKKQWDERRADRGKMDAQEKEIATQQAEIIALRAENERMKNASGLVSSTGGRLESE